jgi:hypothetical protein
VAAEPQDGGEHLPRVSLPIVIWWGNPAFTMFYNDAYIPILGVTKHPGWLGQSGRECWSEIWLTMGPMWERVFATGEATWSEDFLYVLDRNVPRLRPWMIRAN